MHFKDSYTAEIDCLREKTNLVKDVMRQIMRDEFKVNTGVREYIEKSFRMLYDNMSGKFTYVEPEDREMEINAREVIQTGDGGTRDQKNDKLLDSEFAGGRKQHVDKAKLRERGDKARS